MQVAFWDGVYHAKKTFYIKNNKEILVTHCKLSLENVDVVDNDPRITIPHCLKCLNHLMDD